MVRFFHTIRLILYTQIVSKFEPPKGIIRFGKHNHGVNTDNPRVLTFNINTRIIMGNFCSFAENVTIIGAGGEHPIESVSNFILKPYFLGTSHPAAVLYDRGRPDPHAVQLNKVTIGNDVWVGTGAIIFHGITIGDGAVIGAGAVVTHDVPPYAIVVGVPARILRYRFTQEQIKALLSIAWWNWSEEKIIANIDLFDDVDLFIRKFKVATKE